MSAMVGWLVFGGERKAKISGFVLGSWAEECQEEGDGQGGGNRVPEIGQNASERLCGAKTAQFTSLSYCVT
jgi:hypothetical protein